MDSNLNLYEHLRENSGLSTDLKANLQLPEKLKMICENILYLSSDDVDDLTVFDYNDITATKQNDDQIYTKNYDDTSQAPFNIDKDDNLIHHDSISIASQHLNFNLNLERIEKVANGEMDASKGIFELNEDLDAQSNPYLDMTSEQKQQSSSYNTVTDNRNLKIR